MTQEGRIRSAGATTGLNAAQVQQLVFRRIGTAPYASAAAANAALSAPVPAGEALLATTATGQVLIAYGGATTFTPFGGGVADFASVVANMAARPAVATQADGFRVRTTTNGLTWIVVDGVYEIEDIEPTVATLTARNNLTELQTGQRVYVSEDDTVYRWDGIQWTTKSGSGSSGNFRAPQVAGTLRTTAPVPADVGVPLWAPGSIIKRRLSSGIEQQWITTTTNACVLDDEHRPSEEDPLTVVPTSPVTPNTAAANGWVAGDVFVFRNTTTTPVTYENYVWTAVGVSIVAVKQSYGSSSQTNQTSFPQQYRAPQVVGTQRQVAPLPVNVGAAVFAPGSVIKRRLDSGIEQTWLVDATGVAVLDDERPPDDANPLTTFPISPTPVGSANGWVAGDRFVFRNAATTPATYEVCEWTTVGPNLVAVKQQ
jgi:hypothetical protein